MSTETIETKPWYVVMTDKFMSGWGRAEGKINKFIIGADSLEDAERIERLARARDEMKYINVTATKPYYNKDRYLISYVDVENIHWM